MIGLNQVVISGAVANEPKASRTQSGAACVHFTLCVERVIKGGVSMLYVQITAWGSCAEACGGLGVGSGCTVLGRLSLGKKKDKQGAEQTFLEVIAESVLIHENGVMATPSAPPVQVPGNSQWQQPPQMPAPGYQPPMPPPGYQFPPQQIPVAQNGWNNAR